MPIGRCAKPFGALKKVHTCCIAELHLLPQQDVAAMDKLNFGSNLSFNHLEEPWPEHEPPRLN